MKQDYEKSVERLEEISALLEAGQLPLEQSIKLYEEGARLAAFCTKILEEAEQKITALSTLEEAENET
jgi:exodeoxyribonuclease VII small subunit